MKQLRYSEAFYSLQGEGARAGRAAVFCRFSKCNLWNGREDSRADAVCNFCDTDILGTDGQNGGEFANAQELATKIQVQTSKCWLKQLKIWLSFSFRTIESSTEMKIFYY